MAAEGAVTFVGDSISMKAGADLTALQFRFMKMSATGAVDKAAADTDRTIGILQNKPSNTSSEGPLAALVKVMGGSKLEVDGNAGAISAGSMLTADSVGRGVATTTTNKTVGAIALEGSTVQGDIISVLLVNFVHGV